MVSCVPTVSLFDTNYVGDWVQRQAECLAKCEALSSTGCELVTVQSCDKRVLNHYTTQGGVDSALSEVEHHCDQDVASSVIELEESFQVWYGNIREDHLSL